MFSFPLEETFLQTNSFSCTTSDLLFEWIWWKLDLRRGIYLGVFLKVLIKRMCWISRRTIRLGKFLVCFNSCVNNVKLYFFFFVLFNFICRMIPKCFVNYQKLFWMDLLQMPSLRYQFIFTIESNLELFGSLPKQNEQTVLFKHLFDLHT